MTEAKKPSKFQRYLVVILIALVGGFITKMPYLSGQYNAVMLEALNLTNTQLGLLAMAYGLLNFIVYIPGGWLADRFSYRKLVVIGGLGTALFGFWYAALPSFPMLMVIHTGFAITTVFIFWAAMVKGVNNQGEKDEQGRMFGILEGTRYLIGVIAMLVSTIVFASFAGEASSEAASGFSDPAGGFSAVVVYYSAAVAILSVIVFFIMKEPVNPVTADGKKLEVREMLSTLKYPKLWLCGLIVFCNYLSIACNYSNLYFTNAFGFDAVDAANTTTYVAMFAVVVSAFSAGFIADKIGNRVKFYSYMFIGQTIFAAALLLIPHISLDGATPEQLRAANSTYSLVYIATVALFAFFAYSIKALYFAALDDIKMPKYLAGSSSSVISLIGYLPDIFATTLVGTVLDRNMWLGFKFSFAMMAIPAAVGFVVSLVLLKMIKKDESVAVEAPAEEETAVISEPAEDETFVKDEPFAVEETESKDGSAEEETVEAEDVKEEKATVDETVAVE